jgi:5-methyltetrahydrofolate--homocysteine methyltransferase
MVTVVTGRDCEVKFGLGLPTVIIGERINPTGRKELAEELKEGKLNIAEEDAKKQAEAGADIIGVNVGAVGVDEEEMLPGAVKKVMEVTNKPICIDSANSKAIKKALEVYPYKALINSVNGEERSMEKILPLVKESGNAVVCITMDEKDIPNSIETRVNIAKRIMQRVESLGISREDIVIDCLAMTVATDSNSAKVTLETLKRVTEEFGVSTTIGVSNISFGMPNHSLLNIHFLSMAILNGLTAPIVDPLTSGLLEAIRAADFLVGRDPYGMNYISIYRKK